MNKEPVVELAPIRLAPQATEADLVRTSDMLQKELLECSEGFAGRLLLKRLDGAYLDIVLWQSLEAANAVMQVATSSSACAAYFACMVMGDDPAEGVEHLTILKSYGFAVPPAEGEVSDGIGPTV